jgi:hypothetical protein
MATSRDPLDPTELWIIVERFGFEYRSLTGMLIFAVRLAVLTLALLSEFCK